MAIDNYGRVMRKVSKHPQHIYEVIVGQPGPYASTITYRVEVSAGSRYEADRKACREISSTTVFDGWIAKKITRIDNG